ncbi:MAG: GxxExxY protein [Caldilineaceae bacterium]
MTSLLHKELTYYLRGLGFRIHNALGGGHPEKHYETAVVAGLEADHIPFLHQHTYWITYRNQQIGQYRPDFTLANGAVQLDLKATPQITSLHKAQLLSYLAVTNAELGFIMNFGARSMQYDRLPNFLSSRQRSPIRRPLDPKLLYPELTNQVLDVLYTVHFTLGTGFWHKVYRRATRIELRHLGVPFVFLRELPLTYAGQVIAMRPTRLMVVEQKVLLATVALDRITATHTEKLRWAQQITGCQLAMLANFAPTQLDVRFLRI